MVAPIHQPIVKIKDPPSPDLIERLASEVDLPELLIRLLVSRGCRTRDEVISFLKPDFSHLHDPFLMEGMGRSVERLLGAIDSGELITLWGDYDVDGVTGVALLHRTLRRLGGRVRVYIPLRKPEGYGLSEKGVEEAVEAGSTLIVTVDCGVSAVREIDLCATESIDVIVTDHHLPPETLPSAVAVLDPKLEGSAYPGRELAGVGVAFKLVQALWKRKELPTDSLKEELDLVALGTLADVVPLTGENRFFCRMGMEELNRTTKCGLEALLKVSGIYGKRLEPYHVGFVLAPRLNAAGRMADASKAVELLITDDESRANELARELDSHNAERKSVENMILTQALSMVEEGDMAEEPVFVLSSEDWHPGVIGICASRVVEKYFRPTILIALDGESGKGSGRSVPAFHMYEALSQCEECLDQFGGHSQAAGLQIAAENIDRFHDRFKEVAERVLKPEDLVPTVVVDMELRFGEIGENLSRILKMFEPYGPSNPRPLFLTRGVEVVGTPKVVGDRHLKLTLRQEGRVFPAIGFGLGDFITRVEVARPDLSIVYSLGEDDFTGNRKTVLKLRSVWQEGNRGDPI